MIGICATRGKVVSVNAEENFAEKGGLIEEVIGIREEREVK